MLSNHLRQYLLAMVGIILLGCESSASRMIGELRHDDPQVRRKAARALADPQYAGNEQVVAALNTAMADPDFPVREAAITSLSRFGERARSALPAIKDSLTSDEASVRLAAARAIVRIEPTSTDYQAVFLEALRAGNGPIFLEIGKMGKEAQWAVPTLIELLKDQRTHVRALAAKTLGEIGIASSEVRTALQRHVNDTESSVRKAALTALNRLSP